MKKSYDYTIFKGCHRCFGSKRITCNSCNGLVVVCAGDWFIIILFILNITRKNA